ncbi:MAG: hypothetical protein ACJARS_005115, partial [bacterium]
MRSAFFIAACLGTTSAHAVSLSLQATDHPYDGITIEQYRASNPSTDVWVARIDLCEAGVHVDATATTNVLRSASSWGQNVGAQLATNGDFYGTGPLRVYGEAVGSGVSWPILQTGGHSSYSSAWYYEDYGWIAFGHDRVDYTHTKWVKNNAAVFGGDLGGYRPGAIAPDPRPGTLALVSGFPELVVEGQVVTCSSPTANTCFPDR